MNQPTANRRESPLWGPRAGELGAQVLIGLLAALLLFWGLSRKYLWQDEAFTAVLAERMLQYGKPLSYDGKNLLTSDNFQAEDPATIGERTHDPAAAVNYYAQRGDFRADTTWIFQPWGQFVVAAASLELFGRTTFAARLPFALAGLATVLLLFRLVRVYFNSVLMASIAALLLTLNTYWILHARQCRYYSLSTLFLVLTLLAYARWQWGGLSGRTFGGKWGAAAFVAAAWCWFQVDYGTVWPVLGVLFVDAFIAHRREFWKPAVVWGILAAPIAPFVYYYKMAGRLSVQAGSWIDRFQGNFFNVNEYVAPALIVLAAAILAAARRRKLPDSQRRLIAMGCAALAALAIWIPTVAPATFLRYAVAATPIGCLLAAWVFVSITERAPQFAWAGAAVLVFTPWLSVPARAMLQPPAWVKPDLAFRREISTLAVEVFGHRPDPNRIVIEWLKENAASTDEILINYEDVPLMFYLPNPIRGGVPAFRAEDDSRMPPRFAIMRQSVSFVHWPVFVREINRYRWSEAAVKAPDITWGNNPDPIGQIQNPSTAPPLFIARRVEGP